MSEALRALVDAQLRVIKQLPAGDLSLIVLKGHLLIEELLHIIVKKAAKYPDAVEEAHLRFYQLAHVAKALTYEKQLKPVWDAILALNTLRNMFAHNLEVKSLEKNLRLFARAAGGDPEAEELVVRNPEYQIATSVEFICGVLAGIAFLPPAIKS